jgi:U3 small nucleolar RNA-associated protein 21
MNRKVITTSLDGSLKVWDFHTGLPIHTLCVESPISHMVYQRESELAAVVCDDLGIRIIDTEACKIVREFWGHRNRITDLVWALRFHS